MNYLFQYIHRLSPDDLESHAPSWDLFVSCYNRSDRVLGAFERLRAPERWWVVQPEYDFSTEEVALLGPSVLQPPSGSEAEFVDHIIQTLSINASTRVCIDVTGFMRHSLLALMARLKYMGMERYWLLYSDPDVYPREELAEFSRSGIDDVRAVAGLQGSHDLAEHERDWIVLGTGYDNAMMSEALERKRHARRLDVLGLPSLQPSMYQENVLSVLRTSEEVGSEGPANAIFAPASNPFATAALLHDQLSARLLSGEISNLYLVPTGTKPQVVGFGMFFLQECADLAASVLVPFPVKYTPESSTGLSRSWIFEIDHSLW